MLKLGFGLLVTAVAAIWVGATLQRGCRDVQSSVTHLDYYPIRDMRRSVVVSPQKVWLQPPDTVSVPVTGRERAPSAKELEVDREAATARFTNPVAADDSSLARGLRLYGRFCAPCHGKSLSGDGPVAAQFMPPPDLLGSTVRGRTDGYLYSYIRYGGPIMPTYGYAMSPEEAWDVINYVRAEQRANPR